MLSAYLYYGQSMDLNPINVRNIECCSKSQTLKLVRFYFGGQEGRGLLTPLKVF